MPAQKRTNAKKSSRSSSKKSATSGESIRVSDLLDALRRANQGQSIRVPRDAHPDVVKIFDEVKLLAQRGSLPDQPSSTAPVVAKPIENLAEATARISDLPDRLVGVSDALADACAVIDHLPSAEETQNNANETERLFSECLHHCEDGIEASLKTISEIYRTKESTQLAVSVISNLGFRLEAMKEMCAGISSSSNELKVIAVNAQILAAQMGKHGQSFRFVGEKIEEAGKGIESHVRDIDQMISTIRDESLQAIEVVERGAQSVDPGVEQANTVERELKYVLDHCRRLQELGRSSSQAITSWKQATESLHGAAGTVKPVLAETIALASWGSNLHKMTEQTRNELMKSAIEQWVSLGGRLIDFTERMERATSAQEQTFRRLGEVLDKFEQPAPIVKNRRK